MARRPPYTEVAKAHQVRAAHVKGMGDVVFRVFQCFNPECTELLIVNEDDVRDVFEVACPTCGFVHKSGEVKKFYDYKLIEKKSQKTIEAGAFEILIDDYIAESARYKYCIICNCLKPLDAFDRHASRKSGRQGECRLCKTVYNGIKNQSRITDQHKEAAQKRRLYVDITGSGKIDSGKIRERFDNKCFKCKCDLPDPKDGHLDHTLPVSLLWPLTTDNATLLCGKHNTEKAGKWPSQYYTDKELRELSVRTGISYQLLKGEPQINPEALKALRQKAFVDSILSKYAPYIDEIIKVRNRILKMTNFDFFSVSTSISQDLVASANAVLGKTPMTSELDIDEP